MLSEKLVFKSHLFEESSIDFVGTCEEIKFVKIFVEPDVQENYEQSEARRVGSEKPSIQHFEINSGMRSL